VRARGVSLRPAVSTTDQWVVTNAGRCGASLPLEVVPGFAAGEGVLTPPD
jgi:hypothetical protein